MRNVINHTNQMTDTQTVDTTGMSRPGTLSAQLYNGCTAPSIVSQTSGGVVSAGAAIVLSAVVVSGATTPFTVQWFDGNDQALTQPVTTSSTHHQLSVSPSQTTQYYVSIANRCRTVASGLMKVAVGNCVQPWISSATSVKRPQGGYDLSVLANGTGTLAYVWKQGPTVIATTGPTITVYPTQTTGYTVTVTNACGGDGETAYVEVSMPLAMTSVVTAQRNGSGIAVNWTATPIASRYTVERLENGQWTSRGQTTSTSFQDGSTAAGKTYAYRVVATRDDPYAASVPSRPDVATMRTFTPVVSGGPISVAVMNDLLGAVNAARAMSGWAALSWTTILSPQDPAPIANGVILGRHVLALRMRMSEALHAAGLPPQPFTDSNTIHTGIKAAHLLELQERTQ